jgi:hypothetical protein
MQVPAFGQTTVYTDRATFEANVQAGSYLETFDGVPATGEVTSPRAFTGGSSNQFGFSAATANGTSLFYATDPADVTMTDIWLGAFEADTAINFTMTTPNVTAIGANFFLTSIVNTQPVAGTITVALNNGANQTLGPITTDATFIGFTAAAPITSLTFNLTSTVPTTGFATLNDFRIGVAVPEPSSVALLASGLAVAGLAYRRSRRRGC